MKQFSIFNFQFLIALALSLSFTACSDDENEAIIEDGYSMTYNLHFGGDGDDADEAIKTYYVATGLADGCDEETVTVTGRDSAACNKSFRAIMAKAEATLNSKADWEEAVSIVARDSNDSLIYRKIYGAAGDNSTYNSAEPLRTKDGKTMATTDKLFIKDYYVDSWKSGSGYKWYSSDTYYTYPDLNDAAGGTYVYMSAVPTDNIEEAITGAFVLCCQFPDTVPHELTYNGVVYSCSSELDGGEQPNYRNRDLNEKAGGRWLYLYTTHDPSLGQALVWGTHTCTTISVGDQGYGFEDAQLSDFLKGYYKATQVGDVIEFMPGTVCCYSLDDIKDIKLRYRDVDYNMEMGQELNECAGGSYYYLLHQWKKHTFATTGSHENKNGESVDWVQLWAGGPRFAKWNVGAKKETDTGALYQWSGGGSLQESTDYLEKDIIRGDREYDSATALWGPRWVTPSQEQMQGLVDNCDYEFIRIGDVDGLKFTGRGDYAGNTLFFPAIAGNYTEPTDTPLYSTTYGAYWTSTGVDRLNAYYFNFFKFDYNDTHTLNLKVEEENKHDVHVIRPVLMY